MYNNILDYEPNKAKRNTKKEYASKYMDNKDFKELIAHIKIQLKQKREGDD